MTLKKNIAHVSSEGIRHVGLPPWLSSKKNLPAMQETQEL